MLIKLISTVFEVVVTALSATGADNSSWAAAASGDGGNCGVAVREW